jgi:hypothetical protein
MEQQKKPIFCTLVQFGQLSWTIVSGFQEQAKRWSVVDLDG